MYLLGVLVLKTNTPCLSLVACLAYFEEKQGHTFPIVVLHVCIRILLLGRLQKYAGC
jgi:hypothetical protein